MFQISYLNGRQNTAKIKLPWLKKLENQRKKFGLQQICDLCVFFTWLKIRIAI